MKELITKVIGFRPLAGCKLSRERRKSAFSSRSFRPLAGCKLFQDEIKSWANLGTCFRPLTGCKLFQKAREFAEKRMERFSSPGGVWVVSKKIIVIAMIIGIVFVPWRGVSCFGVEQ